MAISFYLLRVLLVAPWRAGLSGRQEKVRPRFLRDSRDTPGMLEIHQVCESFKEGEPFVHEIQTGSEDIIST